MLPRISIVTPSFNSEKHIEATIRSVLDQGYPNLEFLVFDGGSMDGTVDILGRYENHLKWVSEKDKGQSDAINKGLAIATGDIVSWINSNDVYLPGSFDIVSRYFSFHHDVDLLFGRAMLISEVGEELGEYSEVGPPKETVERMLSINAEDRGHFQCILNEHAGWIPQQTAFWKTELMNRVGFLDTDLHYAMDYEYWLRLGSKGRIHFVDAFLGGFRLHENAKSGNARKHWKEILSVNRRYGGEWFSNVHWQFLQAAFKGVMRRLRITRTSGLRGLIT